MTDGCGSRLAYHRDMSQLAVAIVGPGWSGTTRRLAAVVEGEEGDATWESGKGEPKKEAGEAMGFPSYETLSSQVDPGGGELMARESLKLLKNLRGK